VPFLYTWYAREVDRDMLRASERPHGVARAQLSAWFNEHHPEPEPFFRIALSAKGTTLYHLLDLGTEVTHPIYMVGKQSANLYIYQMSSESHDALQALNVRYLISGRKMGRHDLQLVDRFDDMRLYEFVDWSPDPFAIVEGSGAVSLLTFEDEEIVVQAAPGSSGRLRLNVSHYPNWRATRDGEPVEIEATPLSGVPHTGFMTVDLAPGTYRFVFGWRWVEWVAWLASVFGLLGSGLLVLADHGWGRRITSTLVAAEEWLVRWIDGHRNTTWVVGVALLLAGLVAAMAPALWTPPISDGKAPYPVERVYFDLADSLSEAEVYLDGEPCTRVADQFVCEDVGRVFVRTDRFGSDTVHRCIAVESTKKAYFKLEFQKVPPGGALVGFYGNTRAANATKVRVVVEREKVFEDTARASGGVHPLHIPLSRTNPFRLTFQTETAGAQTLCLNAQVVDLEATTSPSP